MIDTARLESIIERSGMKRQFIADAVGITIQTLKRKISGISPITNVEIDKLSDILCLTTRERNEIFFFKK